MTHLVLIARLALAGVLLVSAVAKARAFEDSRTMLDGLLRRIGPRGDRLARPATVALIAAEALTGLALLGPGTTVRVGWVAAAVLTAGFTVLAVVATVTRAEVSCACFGRPAARLGPRHVVRNAPLLGLALLGLWGVWAGTAPSGYPEAPAVALCAVTAAVITAVTAYFDDIADLVVNP
ncbi:MauE/DoxX family redox-associated membrane protein [Streptomyces sp. NPDC002490]|uniref:MauE/DoxX family redox-associated membrane protein n=1 Tax=Streptomyces sp. NPDC002490 TaxID=3154416 RepID=UPI003320F13A